MSLGAACALALALPVADVSAETPRQQDRAAIQRVLDERAAAILNRDRTAFRSTLAAFDPGFVRRQMKTFEWMRRLDLASYELHAAWDRYGDFATASDDKRYSEADAVSIPLVEERYRISGFDPEPANEDLYLTFVRVDGTWKIASDTDLDDLTLLSARHLWSFEPIYVDRSDHFLLIGHPCRERADEPCASLRPDLLDLAETALERVNRYWDVPWNRKVIILVPDTEAELGRMIQSTFDLDDFVAFAYSTVASDLDFVGHRIILNWRALAGRSAETLTVVLAHELLHIATRAASGPFVPIFVEEGLAEHVGHDADPRILSLIAASIAGGAFDGRLPRDFEFTTGDTTSIIGSYQEAQSAVRYFVSRWGIDRFNRFYRRLGERRLAFGTTRYHVDRALRLTIGMGLKAFERAWAQASTG